MERRRSNPRLRRRARHVLVLALFCLAACGGSSPPPPPTVTITASATTVAPGATVTLTWTSTHVQSCQAQGQWSGPLPLSGTKTLYPPTANNDFGIGCSGPDGSATAGASVSVMLPNYTVTNVSLYGVSALNDSGGVAGWIGFPPTPAGPRPYDKAAWTSGSAPPLSPPPPGQDPLSNCPPDPYTGGSMCASRANGINSAGEVVVSVLGGPLGQMVIHYGPGSATVVAGLVSATAIDDADTIVGQTLGRHAGVFASGATVDLGTLGGTSSMANAINAAGQIVGSALLAGDMAEHAFLSTGAGAGLVDLGDLGGGTSVAWAVNDAGVVVGESKASNGETHAFLYADGQMVDIGAAYGAYNWATGINNAGLIVGFFVPANSTDGKPHPFLYGNGTMFDLLDVAARPESYPAGEAVWLGNGYVRINNEGQILVPLCDGDSGPPYHTFQCWAVLLMPSASP